MIEPRFEAGWMPYADDVRGTGFAAFLRPYSEDWYDMFPCSTWWAAQVRAMQIADAVADCAYIGGPDFEGEER